MNNVFELARVTDRVLKVLERCRPVAAAAVLLPLLSSLLLPPADPTLPAAALPGRRLGVLRGHQALAEARPRAAAESHREVRCYCSSCRSFMRCC